MSVHLPLLLLLLLLHTVQCRSIWCVCTTAHCHQQGSNRCNTTGMCYTQFLDLGDGSDPVVRGCVSSKTPLLCENRRPADVPTWPVLVCCSSDLCNHQAVPNTSLTTVTRYVMSSFSGSDFQSSSSTEVSTGQADEHLLGSGSPAYAAALAVGLCGLLTMGLVGVWVLMRRRRRLRQPDYGVIARGRKEDAVIDSPTPPNSPCRALYQHKFTPT